MTLLASIEKRPEKEKKPALRRGVEKDVGKEAEKKANLAQ